MSNKSWDVFWRAKPKTLKLQKAEKKKWIEKKKQHFCLFFHFLRKDTHKEDVAHFILDDDDDDESASAFFLFSFLFSSSSVFETKE